MLVKKRWVATIVALSKGLQMTVQQQQQQVQQVEQMCASASGRFEALASAAQS